MNIEKIFDYARENNISDIHLLEGEKIYFRKYGEIKIRAVTFLHKYIKNSSLLARFLNG